MNRQILEAPIRDIIQNIPPGHSFDSHEIIRQLLRGHSEEYFRFIASFDQEVLTTETVHGHVGQIIASMENVVVQKNMAFSSNIHGKPSPCHSFVKR